MTFISRRDLLKRVAAVPVAGAIGPVAAANQPDSSPAPMPGGAGIGMTQVRAPLESLTASEMELLDAVVARLIPADASGPGAGEAQAARYIDRALAGALSGSRQAYAEGLAALDHFARSTRGKAFAALMPSEQDAVLRDMESGAATGFTGGSAAFFSLLLAHTHQGMFGDPYYGGNVNFIGWDLLGYPGVRTMVTPSDQQQLESNQLAPNHKSAYDYAAFTKASAR